MSKFIGIGQCGNNNIADLIKNQIITKEQALMLNTTLRDVPKEFADIAVEFGDGIGGSGKERHKAKESLVQSIKDGKLDVLDSIITDNDDTVYIITSTEGGSGSGSALTVAAYYKRVHNMNVHIVAFTGYEDDARGIRNTIEFFKEIDESYIVQVISNKKFLEEANNNRMVSNVLANQELCKRLQINLGMLMIDGEHNIDDTDLYKINTTPGLITIEYSHIDRNTKNIEGFNKILSNMIDKSKSIDVINPGAQRIGVIINAGENTREFIDFTFEKLKAKYGVPVELYTHIQNNGGVEFINVIASGMRLPLEEMQDTLDRYEESIAKVRTKDDFFNHINKFDVSDIDQFNIKEPEAPSNISSKKTDFLSSIGVESKSSSDDKVNKTTSKKSEFLNDIGGY